MLFNLTADPDENHNLLVPEKSKSLEAITTIMEKNLLSVVDYPSVARDVAQYNKESFRWWVNASGPSWKQQVHAPGLRWDQSWDANATAALAALSKWLDDDQPATVEACRPSMVWPPASEQYSVN